MKKLISVFLGVVLAVGAVLNFNSFEKKEKYVAVTDKVMTAVVEIHVVGLVANPLLAELDKMFGSRMSDDPSTWIKAGVLGSGVFIDSNGYILTVAHLFNHFKKVQTVTVIAVNDDIVAGTIKLVSESVDLALVKVDYYKTTPWVQIANPRGLRVGQEAVAIGSPSGLSFSVSNGIISALYRDLEFSYNVTQSNTSINPGNSGGPLFNLKGELIGINSFYIVTNNIPVFTGLGFSVQSGQCIEFLTKAAQKFPDMRKSRLIDRVMFKTYVF